MMIVIHYLLCLAMLACGYMIATTYAKDEFDRVCGWTAVTVAAVSGIILLRGGV